MIAASEPVEYIPGGRQIILRHPESVTNQQLLNNQTVEGESILLQKFSEVNISDTLPKEFWIVRENDTCGEEELYCSGKIAIHSKGNQTAKILETTYTCETDIKHALWCKFHTNIPDHLARGKETDEEDNSDKTIECICLIDSYTLKVFTNLGEDYVSSLQFQVSAVWSTRYGILLEKTQVPISETRYTSLERNRLQLHNDTNLPVVFSLTHPLDEICPVLIKHGNISYMYDSNQQIVFTSSEPSLAVIYDTKTGLHSVYKIRKASTEECQMVCGNSDTTPSMFNQSASASPLNIGSNLSCNKSTNKGHLSIFGVPNPQFNIGLGMSNSPFGSRTSYTTTCSGGPSPSQQQQQHSRSQSPMATISRCQSPTHSAFSPLLGAPANSIIHHTRLHQTVMASVLNQTQNSPFGSCSNIQLQDVISPSKPLYPEICLDHVWTENVGIPKDVISSRASKVFLSSDFVGQNYLCYLVPHRSQLSLVRLEKTNKQQQIIFGMVTNIVAKGAVNIPSLHIIAIMDLSNAVVLYSGVTCIGKLHVTGILPNLTGYNYFLSNINHKLGSPFPRRSSLISQNCAASHDIKFEEGLHLLSPVGGNCARPPILLENSLIENNFLVLKEAVGNKITLEYGSKNYFRITLPTSSTSPLVTKCLQTLRSVLQKDLAMQLLVKWYGARNAPGPQDFSSEQEWYLFLVVLFTLLGYEVEKLQLIQKNEKDQLNERNSPIVVSKKQKTNNSGSNDDWKYMTNFMKNGSSKIFISNILGLQKTSNIIQTSVPHIIESNNTGKINTQSILFPYFPLVLLSLHLLYEELKLNCVMSESLHLLAQLLYQLSLDLKFDVYAHHYFLDFQSVYYLKNAVSQMKEADLQKITMPNYIPLKPPNIFETLNNLLNGMEVTPFPYLSQVNLKTKNIIYLIALIANENKPIVLEIDRFIKHIIPVGSRIDFQESGNKFEKEICKNIECSAIDRIVLLYHELGMNKKDLETLPPGVSLLLKDIMYRCRERPPSNWPMQVYELVDRQDLSALGEHLKSSVLNHLENEGKNYSIKDPEQDDGMEFDDAVLKLRFNKDHRIAEVRKLLNSSKPNVQVAALMGVGLVYQGTAHRHISHALLSEIGRPPGPEMKNCIDRESYSLAAGLALGLVVLGCGGGPDLANIPDTLHYYMVGGHVRPFTGAQKDKYKSPSYQIREGDSINIDVTSPGATIALGLMYFDTGNKAVAEWMQAPDTQYLLDFVRPDFLLLRILAKSLILWNEIEPTKSWVSSHVPNIVYKYRLQKPTSEIGQNVDLETMNQAYCNIIAGACMALGLKFAGTANRNAFKTLYNYAQMFTALSHKTIAELAGKSTIETCLNVTLLSAAVVMAGTGNLEIMRICRHIRTRVGPASNVVTYGSHLATHMALGLLFLGGGKYTLSNSPSAVAALIISLFPKFPTHSNDNRYHLQALRHLYVLAAEPRVILPRDIDSGQYCYATVHLTFESEKDGDGQDLILQAPCLLPQLCTIKKIELKDDRYWEIIFVKDHNWQQLENMLKKCETLDVKQRAGCLPYIEDPHGFRSLIAQTLTTENVIAWAARPECVTSFTNDKTILNIVKCFLQWPKQNKTKTEISFKMQSCGSLAKNSSGYLSQSLSNTSERISGSWNEQSDSSNEKMEIVETLSCSKDANSFCKYDGQHSEMTEFEKQFLHTFAIIVYECVIKDKVSLLPLWVNLIKSMEIIEKEPNSFSIWQIKLVSSQMLKKSYIESKNPVLGTESILAIKQNISYIMDSWERELTPHIKSYLTSGNIEENIPLLQRMCTYFVFYDIPYKMDYQTILASLLNTEAKSKIPNVTWYKLYKILKSS
ncbi:anaphase-promoting complex subunit 1 isoform X2 [Bombus bifarius]|uniref:Anaphase-promoting complex subunit 1 isoform X2 n=1 Tax=Bombus bifarius TaxID=103933 RepID=A0A6P8MFX7_9HYME|nr:anaphase-promoting complex subunit 1 isoform X2 [Bombus vancouverensis nearcticus]XP_033307118.1 anaphase-promoting complex subunit 1 isoform X2 [Bombus bifarius]